MLSRNKRGTQHIMVALDMMIDVTLKIRLVPIRMNYG